MQTLVRWLKRLLPTAVGLGLFAGVILANADDLDEWERQWDKLGEEIHVGWIVLTLILTAGHFLLRGMRWVALVRPIQRVPQWPSTRITVVGLMLNNVLPLRLGDLFRPVMGRMRLGLPITDGLLTLVVERILDLALMLTIVLVAVVVLDPVAAFRTVNLPNAEGVATAIETSVAVMAGLMLVAIVVLIVTAWRPGPLARAALKGSRMLPRRIRRLVLQGLTHAVQGVRVLGRPRRLLPMALWTLGVWASQALFIWTTFMAFGVDLGVTGAVVTMAFVNALITLPLAPGHVGTFHTGTVAALVLLGVAGAAQANILAISFHLIQYLPLTLMGLIFWWVDGFRMTDLRGLRAELRRQADGSSTAS